MGKSRLWIIAIVYLCFSSLTITKFPKVWLDTSWTSIASYHLAVEGKLANPLYKKNNFDQRILTPQILQRVLLAGVYGTFGLGVAQGRLLSVLAGLALIVATYFFTRRYFDSTVAVIAAGLLAMDNIFFLTTRAIRPDIFVALLSCSSLFMAWHALDRGSLKCWAIAGLLAGLSLFTHPNSVLPLMMVLILLIWHFRASIIAAPQFWIFCAAILIAFAPYAIYVIQADLSQNFNTFLAQLGGRADFGQRNWLAAIVGEMERYRGYIYFPKRAPIVLIQLVALVFCLATRNRVARWLAGSIIFYIMMLPLWNPHNRSARYLVMVMPAVSILVAHLAVRLWGSSNRVDRKSPWPRRIAAVSLLAIYCFNQAGADAYMLWRHRENDFAGFCSQIRTVVPPSSRLWANLGFWIGLHDYPYISQLSSFEEVEHFRPEYVLLYDAEIWSDRSATLSRQGRPSEWTLSVRKDMENLCQRRGTLVRKVPDPFYGNIEIYRINWIP